MASPYMTKDRVRDAMSTISVLAQYLGFFLESESDEFLKTIKEFPLSENDIDNIEPKDVVNSVISSEIVKLDVFNTVLICYLHALTRYSPEMKTELILLLITDFRFWGATLMIKTMTMSQRRSRCPYPMPLLGWAHLPN